ncbi:MAG: VOC family protein [Candidatus Binataceae bacterium]
MATPSIARLGHVGIHVHDVEKEKAFYRDVLGLTVTDEDPELGMVFMSARPEVEHHEFLLCGGRKTEPDVRWLQQVSFRCDSADDVVGYFKRFKECGVKLDQIVSHGNAIGVYFFDPEGNRCEVYWNTGLKARQPYVENVDLNRPLDEVMKEIEESVRQHGAAGFVNPEWVKSRGARTLGLDSKD